MADPEAPAPATAACQFQAEAAEARREAARLEAALAEERSAQQWRRFCMLRGVGREGLTDVVAAPQLAAGAREVLGLDLGLRDAERLIAMHDRDGDGALSFPEFVGASATLELDLRRLRSEARELVLAVEWAQMRAARLQREREQSRARRRELLASMPAPNLDTSVATRVLAVLAYTLPCLDALRFFAPGGLDQMHEGLAGILQFAQPFALFLMSGLASRWSLPHLVRFNLNQAIILDMLMSIAHMVLVYQASSRASQLLWVPAGSDVLLVASISVLAYAVISTSTGLAPKGAVFRTLPSTASAQELYGLGGVPFVSTEADRALGSIGGHARAGGAVALSPEELVAEVAKEREGEGEASWVRLRGLAVSLAFTVAFAGYYCWVATRLFHQVCAASPFPEAAFDPPA